MNSEKITKTQIGKCGELLVQLSLLRSGIESAALTTDSGVDLVAYSPYLSSPISIQVKTNLQSKPGGGKGKHALDWWIPENCPAQLVTLVDLSTDSIWVFTMKEVRRLSQQTSKKGHHLGMYTDPTANPRKVGFLMHCHEFDRFKLANRISKLFGV